MSSPSSAKFLIVDDEPDLLAVTDMVLKNWGHKTTCFTDPAKALLAFRLAPDDYAAALLDIRMPHMTGPDLAKELLAIRKNLPIVFMTAFEFDPVIFAHLPLVYKVQDVVKKPYDPQDLCSVVKQHIGTYAA